MAPKRLMCLHSMLTILGPFWYHFRVPRYSSEKLIFLSVILKGCNDHQNHRIPNHVIITYPGVTNINVENQWSPILMVGFPHLRKTFTRGLISMLSSLPFQSTGHRLSHTLQRLRRWLAAVPSLRGVPGGLLASHVPLMKGRLRISAGFSNGNSQKIWAFPKLKSQIHG